MNNISILLFLAFALTVSAINVPLCANGAVSLSFKDTNGTIDSTTRATICHDKKSLFVSWENIDS